MFHTDVLVVGGGHAAIEAAAAAVRVGVDVLLVTQDLEAIGRMSCNPAIGGVAKGQLVREIDALGGLMGEAADANGIHFRMLNASRGAAVWGPRAQQDMDGYSSWMRRRLEAMPRLTLRQAEVERIEPLSDGFLVGLSDGEDLRVRKVVLTTGTFASACLHRGGDCWDGGRVGEPPARAISTTLQELGFSLRRLKTGTPSRLDRSTIDWALTDPQPGDERPWAFSTRSGTVRNLVECAIVRTGPDTHAALRSGFDRSPLFNGQITGIGPRYCPSIEDKVHRFPERESHQLFLEPEGLGNERVYVNGFSSSLPEDVQDAALRTIPALAGCRVIRYGYAVEYDAIDATRLHPTLEARHRPGFFVAGQTCGTSGYEEAAAQGLVAGANAALSVLGKKPFLPDRAGSYIGVLVDDLTSLVLDEPYRLFTSRAEHRLHLRHDNAEERLVPIGREAGLVSDASWEAFQETRSAIGTVQRLLSSTKVTPDQCSDFLRRRDSQALERSATLMDLARRPGIDLEDLLAAFAPDGVNGAFDRLACLALESAIRYAGFFEREARTRERVRKMSGCALPPDIDWAHVDGLSIEARQTLAREKPVTVGEAARLPGVRPADVEVLLLRI
ncbi:MAG: tRNA uridine-5-carboxymethylaminomethyl(34) synthesis enzyme MnmG [Fibrobacteria bacterium]|nr:tRNA uridine-5-carboxymethylaminomethyl(34) synthesis enzyme MnmG [Fibrobacteria bacterium]